MISISNLRCFWHFSCGGCNILQCINSVVNITRNAKCYRLKSKLVFSERDIAFAVFIPPEAMLYLAYNTQKRK